MKSQNKLKFNYSIIVKQRSINKSHEIEMNILTFEKFYIYYFVNYFVFCSDS